MTVTRPLLAAVAAAGLKGTRLDLPSQPLTDTDWETLLVWVRNERLPGLLVHAIADGTLPVTEDQRRTATQAHVESMCLALLLEKRLVEVVDALGSEGIDYRILKGSAVAHLDYQDPSWRSFGDVDLLVRTDEFDDAVAILATAGFCRQYPEPRPGFDGRFGKGTTLAGPNGYEVDLHRTFVGGPYGQLINSDDLFAVSTEFSLAGRSLRALGTEERFLHACFHATLGNTPPRLGSLRDVAQMLLATGIDLDRVRHVCAGWRAEPVMSRAICDAWAVFDLADIIPLSVWAHTYETDAAEERALRPYGPGTSSTVQAVAAFRQVRGITAKSAYARALLLPERGYLERSPAEGQMQRWRRGARTVLRRSSRRMSTS